MSAQRSLRRKAQAQLGAHWANKTMVLLQQKRETEEPYESRGLKMIKLLSLWLLSLVVGYIVLISIVAAVLRWATT